MSYSRWGDSIWDTFWCVSHDKKYQFPSQKLKNEERFEICDFPSYLVSYGTIKNKGIDVVLNEVKEYYSKEHHGRIFDGFVDGKIHYKDGVFDVKNPTYEQILELKGYLEEFIKDVDDWYKWKNYFYYEWYVYLCDDINTFLLKFKIK
jgi:hypothetical protein